MSSWTENYNVETDPFNIIRKKLETNLDAIKICQESERKQYGQTIMSQLKDLKTANMLVLNNRGKFEMISDQELATRTKYVLDQHRQFVHFYKEKEKSRNVSLQKESKELRESKIDHVKEALVSQVEKQISNQNDEQDEILDDMMTALGRLGAMSETIGTELKSQNKELNELSIDVDDAGKSIKIANSKMDRLKNKCNLLWVIAFLGVVFLLLLMALVM